MNVVSIVGMPGSGKSEVARVFEESGFSRVRFGDITDGEVRKRGLELSEDNERYVRELLRQEQGMAAYAILNLPTIDDLLEGISVRDESLTETVYLLQDCTSPVVVPGAMDYTDEANAAFQKFADAGMHAVRSTDPIDSWPGIAL